MKYSELVEGQWYFVTDVDEWPRSQKKKALLVTKREGKGERHDFVTKNLKTGKTANTLKVSSRAVIAPTISPLPKQDTEEWLEMEYNAWEVDNNALQAKWFLDKKEQVIKLLGAVGIDCSSYAYGTSVTIPKEELSKLVKFVELFIGNNLYLEMVDTEQPPVLPYTPSVKTEQKGTANGD